MEDFIIDPEVSSLLVPLTTEELDGLEKQILDGLHVDAGVVGVVEGESILADGHNRRSICLTHGIAFPTRMKTFKSRADLIQWVIDNQFGRRNLTEEWKAFYRGKEYLTTKKAVGRPTDNCEGASQLENGKTPGKTAENVGKKHGVTGRTIHADADFAEAIDKLSDAEKQAVLNGQSGETKKAIADGKKPILCERCMAVGAQLKCEACAEARKAAKKTKTTLSEEIDASLAEPEEDVPDPTIEEIMTAKNSELESFCRGLMKYVEENIPENEWLDYMGRGEGARQKIKDACAAVRSAKCSHVCPMCKGERCKKCEKTGRVPHSIYQQLVG
jgi:hypothetical protein